MPPALTSFKDKIGQPIGTSPWFLIDQARIDLFAKPSEDPDPMHVDPAWCAAKSPWIESKHGA